MCLAIPGKIESIHGTKAVVDFGGIKRQADVSLLDEPVVGEYVIVHVGFAIQKVDESVAYDTYHLLQEMSE
jgi:hydrogenase expression/formation protein HypC